MDELTVGDPSRLATDIGPVIDAEAQAQLVAHIDRVSASARWRHQAEVANGASGTFVPPTMLEIGGLHELKREVFGPVLHVLRYAEADLPQVIEAINSTGYGLTHGLHTRIDEKVTEDLAGIRCGNVYVNRNIVGAVVGVQPFGGHGLSGTGPKAGGPLYLHRLCRGDKAPELHGESVPVAFDALRALEQALPDLADLPAEQARRLVTRIRRYRAESPLNVKLPLPGPTGEDNSLWFEPRGTLACVAPGIQPLLEQLAAAFATHNQALVPDDEVGRRLVRTIAHPAIAFAADPATADIDALLFAGPDDQADALRRTLAAREGAIVPLIQDGADGSYDLTRLVVEKVASINTTAAGGNASLMSLSGE
jgi:RHH-type proline utilization regulon transcriptional repressor/proline dehydrogenase/delta 1-pyrroline-5-carboxylate dehydrogenase